MESYIDKETISYVIQAEEEKSYVKLPMYIDEGTEHIQVSYQFSGKDNGAVVDLGIADPYQFRGWSGGARSEFFITEKDATPGYQRGRLHCGTWHIILGAYRIPEAGCHVEVTVKKTVAEERMWLKGDLHMHTEHSDGSYTLEETFQSVKEKGFDYLATTDHNVATQNRHGFSESDLLIIPGMEWSTYKGHANILGGFNPRESFQVETNEEVSELTHAVVSRGDLWIVNHPFDDGCPWEWDWPEQMKAVEVWNGPWRTINQKAINWWHEQLTKGYRLPAVGGSDTHRPDPYVTHGTPTTWVHAKGRTVESTLEAIRNGRTVISSSADGPRIEVCSGTAFIGDEVAAADVQLDMIVYEGKVGQEVRLYTERGLAATHTLTTAEPTWVQRSDASATRFYRAELWSEDGKQLLSLCNPLYIKE
ncbi:CehA/McbA family metallohydrolase [Bacillaceae bacterium SIJ1]|uniref:CehA/McbA family metallohydrolase n=1 Tax=Litoribacterium kuwaitense TaxID=1398745 RepID=UPI0013EDA05D|nr:CehA/McbA family metallohydrolase [Litoribacterium kuwaitense]NGP46846.1 CehA/McbA family metallohydrolase [Litoribacterium kuwaitense]